MEEKLKKEGVKKRNNYKRDGNTVSKKKANVSKTKRTDDIKT